MASDVEQLLRAVRAPAFTYREPRARGWPRPGRDVAARRAPEELTIAFVAPIAGAGRTSLAASVAYALARHGWRAVAVDLDPNDQLRRHFERGARASAQRLHAEPAHAWRGEDAALPAWVPFGDASSYLDALASDPDAVILDAPAGLSSALDEALALADEVVVVIRPEPASRQAVRATDAFLARMRMRARHRFVARYVVNAFDGRRDTHRAEWAALRRVLGARVSPRPIQWDAALELARASGRDVHELAPASQVAADVESLARDLVGSRGDTRGTAPAAW
jgi:cellulose biosynthesis protein BcsQ